MAFTMEPEKRDLYSSHTTSDESPNEYSPERVPASEIVLPTLHNTTEAKLMRKIDLRVVPALCIMFLLAFLDKVNIANAEVFGMSKEININKGTQYNNALVILYVPYIILEIPSNIYLKKLTPHVWLSCGMLFFGFVTMTQGFVTNYGGILTARFFLGVAETPMYPGAFYIISMWYKRYESQRRFTFFYASISLAGAFGGLLASAIGKMEGVGNYSGWRWIFIIEGLLTMVVGAIFFFVIPDFPETTKWLTAEELAFVQARLAIDQGASAHARQIQFKDVTNVFRDWKVWIAGFMYFALLLPGYSYAYFAPAVIQRFGYTPIQTQLHSVPPWAATFVWCMLIATVSDLTKKRYLWIVVSISMGCIGCIVLLATDHTMIKTQYAMLFLFVMGAYGATSVMVCWFAMNLGGHHRRSVGSAWQIACGQIGGIIAVYSFLKKDKPEYTPGFAICLGFLVLAMLLAGVLFLGYARENRRRDKAGLTKGVETVEEKEVLGDLASGYRYML